MVNLRKKIKETTKILTCDSEKENVQDGNRIKNPPKRQQKGRPSKHKRPKVFSRKKQIK